MLKFLLYPFSWLYGVVIAVRNFLFDKGLLPSKEFHTPVISVGNLAVGGTGKTPHSEYLIRLLQASYRVALLSRGYRRTTKGFILANAAENAQTIGDEPYQIYRKFPQINVAVAEKRVEGIERLLQLSPPPQVVLLDDAFQHRYVRAGLSVLLTDYANRWTTDNLLPYGRLREPRSGAKRADIVIVTKCPPTLSLHEREKIASELDLLPSQTLYFTTYRYGTPSPVFSSTAPFAVDSSQTILMVTGVVSAVGLYDYLAAMFTNVRWLSFPDHHFFTSKDISKIASEMKEISATAVVVTEKDASRLLSMADSLPENLKTRLYSIGVEVDFLDHGKEFDAQIPSFVENRLS